MVRSRMQRVERRSRARGGQQHKYPPHKHYTLQQNTTKKARCRSRTDCASSSCAASRCRRRPTPSSRAWCRSSASTRTRCRDVCVSCVLCCAVLCLCAGGRREGGGCAVFLERVGDCLSFTPSLDSTTTRPTLSGRRALQGGDRGGRRRQGDPHRQLPLPG